MAEKLNPCKYCGSMDIEANTINDPIFGKGTVVIQCNNCKASVSNSSSDPEIAIHNWNFMNSDKSKEPK